MAVIPIMFTYMFLANRCSWQHEMVLVNVKDVDFKGRMYSQRLQSNGQKPHCILAIVLNKPKRAPKIHVVGLKFIYIYIYMNRKYHHQVHNTIYQIGDNSDCSKPLCIYLQLHLSKWITNVSESVTRTSYSLRVCVPTSTINLVFWGTCKMLDLKGVRVVAMTSLIKATSAVFQ